MKSLKNDLMVLELGTPTFQVRRKLNRSAIKISFDHLIHFLPYLISAGAVEYKLFVGSLNKQASEKEVKEVCHNCLAIPFFPDITVTCFSFLSHQINYEVCYLSGSLFSSHIVTWFLVVVVCMPWSS